MDRVTESDKADLDRVAKQAMVACGDSLEAEVTSVRESAKPDIRGPRWPLAVRLTSSMDFGDKAWDMSVTVRGVSASDLQCSERALHAAQFAVGALTRIRAELARSGHPYEMSVETEAAAALCALNWIACNEGGSGEFFRTHRAIDVVSKDHGSLFVITIEGLRTIYLVQVADGAVRRVGLPATA